MGSSTTMGNVNASQACEAEVRAWLMDLMPLEHAPAHLRLAFHDAGTYDARTRTGGAHGTIRLRDELHRSSNTGWAQPCLELIAEVKAIFPEVSWADLIAVGGSAAVHKCNGPAIEVGLGRQDQETVAPPNRLPGGYEDAPLLRRIFARMGLGAGDLVALSGAHVIGHTQRHPFTQHPWRFSNAYYVQLLSQTAPSILQTDSELLRDEQLRPLVELYASDEQQFFEDFARSFRKLTWLGNDPLTPPTAPTGAIRQSPALKT